MNLGNPARRLKTHAKIEREAAGYTEIVLGESKDVGVAIATDGIADILRKCRRRTVLKVCDAGKRKGATEVGIKETVLLVAVGIAAELEGVPPARPGNRVAVSEYVFGAALGNDV